MRAILISASVALVFSLLATPVFIRFLVRRGYGQFIRDDGPTSHSTKRGTPTMGGAVIIASTFIAYAAAHIFTGRAPGISARSEERRVGKESRARGSGERGNKDE